MIFYTRTGKVLRHRTTLIRTVFFLSTVGLAPIVMMAILMLINSLVNLATMTVTIKRGQLLEKLAKEKKVTAKSNAKTSGGNSRNKNSDANKEVSDTALPNCAGTSPDLRVNDNSDDAHEDSDDFVMVHGSKGGRQHASTVATGAQSPVRKRK
eukprot:Rmarinus@m.7520